MANPKRKRPAARPAGTKPSSVPIQAKRARQSKTPKAPKIINHAPTTRLEIFVFGANTDGELGLGSKDLDGAGLFDVEKPRLNTVLSADEVGIVQIACGGQHVVALTRSNELLSWGVNDHGTLGRDPAGAEEDQDEDDELNPKEANPAPVDVSGLDPSIKWTQVVAGDNASFALTADGRVYGWGTFRSAEGVMGFLVGGDRIQKTPVLIPDLEDIRQLAAGDNYVLAVDGQGKVFSWGCGEKSQLGRRTHGSRPAHALRPAGVGRLPVRGAKAAAVGCGSNHSFIIDSEGRVYAFGNNYDGQLALVEGAGESGGSVLRPTMVQGAEQYKIVEIAGGNTHSIACTEEGKLLSWGRIDTHMVGLDQQTFAEFAYMAEGAEKKGSSFPSSSEDGRLVVRNQDAPVQAVQGVPVIMNKPWELRGKCNSCCVLSQQA
jgi:regulator of chromosome condensation